VVDVAFETRAVLGEGPTWDAQAGDLVWVDILSSRVHRFDPATGANTTIDVGSHVGAAKPAVDGSLVLNLVGGLARYDEDGGVQWLAPVGREGVRGNDAGVDATGAIWFGTMRYDEGEGGGKLYRFADGSWSTVLDAVSIANGIDWSPEGDRMYFIDTPTNRIDVFDADPADPGTIANRRTLVDVSEAEGFPDGMCVDAEGFLWVAYWGGSAVRRYSPEGKLDREIALPVPLVTACTFAPNGDLYVSTASVGLSQAELAAAPLAGSLFVVPGAGQGQTSNRVAL
jgi:sugar lactone lactonase YvrE